MDVGDQTDKDYRSDEDIGFLSLSVRSPTSVPEYSSVGGPATLTLPQNIPIKPLKWCEVCVVSVTTVNQYK